MPKRTEDPVIRRDIGARLRRSRGEQGWSQERLAEALGVDTMTVSRIETGRRSLSAAAAVHAAEALGVPVWALLGVAGAPVAGIEDEAVLLLRTMDERHREAAMRMLREIARLQS